MVRTMSGAIVPNPNMKRTDRDITAFGDVIEVAILPVIGPDGLPLRLFGNAVVRDVDLDGHFGIVDKYGEIHWIEINFG